MKKLVLVSIFFLATVSMFAQTQNAASTPLKIGYVDSQVIMTQYPAAIKAQSDLEAAVTEWNQKIEGMKKDFQQIMADYQKKFEKMKDEEKKAAQADVAKREQEIAQYQQEKFAQPGGELYKKQEQLLAPIKKKIYEAIEAVAKDENLKFVFDKTGDAFLLYGDSEFDMTFKVLDKLKRGK